MDLAPPDTLAIQRLHALDDLRAVGDDWQDLWTRCGDATPFQSPAWLVPWWRAYGEGPLLSWAFRRGGRLVGLAPFYVYGNPPERRLFLIGTGNSDYLDLLCEPAFAADILTETFRLLADHAASWDLCEFHQLRPEAKLLSAMPPAPFVAETLIEETCPVLDLAGFTGPGERGVGRSAWHKAVYYRRRAAKLGRLETEIADAARFDEFFDALAELHARRWRAAGQPGIFGERDIAFHRDTARAMLEHGILRLHAVRLDRRILAVLYGWHAHRRSYFYITGFDPDAAALGPGTLIVAAAIEHAAREGAVAIDFMRGGEAHKYRWGAVGRPNTLRRLRLAPAQ